LLLRQGLPTQAAGASAAAPANAGTATQSGANHNGPQRKP
jgi:hypothetical protein